MKTSPSLEVVMITGASAGVGRSTALEFARRRARLGLLARGKERLAATKKEVEHLGGEAIIISADVADAKQVEAAADELEATFGPIDIWINNAMVSVFSPVKEMQAEDYRRVTEVTYLGVVYGTLSALRRMLPRNQGRILQVGSALAFRGIPLQSAYCAAKHAVEGFMESLRTELLHDKSRVQASMVHIPAINTPHFSWVKSRLPKKPQPVPPIYQPEVAARAIYWAAHHNRTEIEVGFPTVIAHFANEMAPRLVDRYLAKTGYQTQQTAVPEDPDRPNNLWKPVQGDFGAHGIFDKGAHAFSPQFWMNTHRAALGLGALIAAGLLTWRNVWPVKHRTVSNGNGKH